MLCCFHAARLLIGLVRWYLCICALWEGLFVVYHQIRSVEFPFNPLCG